MTAIQKLHDDPFPLASQKKVAEALLDKLNDNN